jgi:hypothetical protein
MLNQLKRFLNFFRPRKQRLTHATRLAYLRACGV